MDQSAALEFSILERLSKQGPMPLEYLSCLLPRCTWNQLFAAVDHLSREGKVTLRRVDRCLYELSLGQQFAGTGPNVTPSDPKVMREPAARNNSRSLPEKRSDSFKEAYPLRWTLDHNKI